MTEEIVPSDVQHGEVLGGPVETIRELPQSPTGAEMVLVRQGESYFVVSSVVAAFSGFETLVFPADADGNITDWGEVAGGRGMSREAAIAQLEENGPWTDLWDD